MNKKTFRVIKGYSELSYEERKEIRELIERYEKTKFEERKIVIKALNESVGPLDSDNCPCCGRQIATDILNVIRQLQSQLIFYRAVYIFYY